MSMKTETKQSGSMQSVTLGSAPTEGRHPHPGQVMKILKCGAFLSVLAMSQREIKSQVNQWVIPGGGMNPEGLEFPDKICVPSKHTLVLSPTHLKSWFKGLHTHHGAT